MVDYSSIINEINNDVIQEVENKPEEAEKDINNAGEVFKNEDVSKRLDELRNSMTSSSKSKQSEGLSRGDSNVVDAPFVEVNKRKEEKKESTTTTTTTSTGWPWGGSKTTTVVKEKTPQQKVAEMGNDLLKDALEEVEMEIKLEKQKQKVMPSNWSIFDLHEEQLVKEENQKMEKKKPKKPKKPNRTKDTFKVALLEGVIFSGKAIVEMICLSKFDKSPQGENKTEKKEHTFRY